MQKREEREKKEMKGDRRKREKNDRHRQAETTKPLRKKTQDLERRAINSITASSQRRKKRERKPESK